MSGEFTVHGFPEVVAPRGLWWKEGTLQMQLSGRWAVCRPGHAPVGIDSGDLFLVEVAGKEGLQPKRMEFRQFTGPMKGRTLRGLDGEYCSVDDYHLANGLRAAIGASAD